MKTKKTTRTLKVANVGDGYRKEVIPQIRLEGKWLLAAGIIPDQHVVVTNPKEGILVLSLE